MNFLRPENIFLFNLGQDLGSTRDFSHLLSDEFYQGRHVVNQTCEKVDLKNARSSQDFKSRSRRFSGVALSNVAFESCEREKVKAYMNFSSPEKIFKLNLWAQLGSLFDFSHLLSHEFYQSQCF